MSYVENNLMSGEKVIYKASIHWFIFVPSITLALLGFLMIAGGRQSGNLGIGAIGGILVLFSIISFIKACIAKISTELAVTSKRVIAKVGLIRRNTVELNHSKVESFNIDQSIFGRIFGYGTILVSGTGGGKTPISGIDSPLEFRRKAMETIDQSQQA